MDLSVIVLVQHASDRLPGIIRHILSQEDAELEILCVYDVRTSKHSTEVLHQIVSKNTVFSFETTGDGQSVRQQISHALTCARGQYVMLLDEHCQLTDHACTALLKEICQRQADALRFSLQANAQNQVCHEDVAWLTHLLPWGYIYRKKVIQKVIVLLPDDGGTGFLDLLTPYCLQLCADQVESLEQAYITYDAEALLADWRLMSDQFRFYEAQYSMAQCAQKATDEVTKTTSAIREPCMDIMLWNWLQCIPSPHAATLFEQLVELTDKEDLLTCLSSHWKEWSIQTDQFVSCIAGTTLMTKNNPPVRTVGSMYYRAYNGGIERVMSELARIWSENGYRVVMITDEEPNALDYPCPDSVLRVSLHWNEADNRNDRQRIHDLIHTLETNQIDTVVYHAWFSRNALMDILTMKLSGASVIVHTHGRFSTGFRYGRPDYGIAHTNLGMTYQLADAVIALSDVDACWWSHWHPNVHKVCNPLSISYDAIQPTEVENHELLWIGRISPEKQPEMALEIIDRIRRIIPDARLHMVGTADSPAIQEHFQQLITQMHLDDHVVLHGFQKNVIPFYDQCATVLFTSALEGFQLTLTESKVMARPCVIFNIPNLDMIRDGQGMIVVPQGDIQSAADATTEILTDHSKWLRLSREARESARKLCSFDYPGKWRTIFQSVSQRQKASQNAPPEIMVHVLANDLTVGYQNEAADLQWRDVRILELEDWCTQQDGTKAWLNDQIQNLQVQLQQQDDQIQNCHSESEWLKAQNQSLANRNQELQTWSDQQASQIEELQNTVAEQQKGKAWLEEQHQVLDARNQELQAWSDKQASQIEELQNTVAEQQKGKAWLEAQHQALDARNQELQAWSDKQASQIEELQNTVAEQQKGKAWLEEQHQALDTRNRELQAWSDKQASQIEELQNTIAEQQKAKAWLEAQHQALDARNQELQAWSDKQASQIEELENTVAEQQKGKAWLEEQHQALEVRNQELRAWSDKQDLQIAGLQHLKSLLEKQNLTLEAMVNLYRDQKHALESNF